MSSVKPSRVVFQLPNVGSWFENIAVAADGTILASRVDAPEVWKVDPTTGQGEKWVGFSAPITSATGIAELKDGLFAIGVGIYDLAKGGAVAGSFEIWTATYAPGTAPDPKKIIALHDMGLLNGMDRWDDTRVLVADSVPGSIYLVDIAKATSTVPITDPLVGMPENPILPIAANGVRASADKKHVYFTNTARLLLGRVAVNADARPTAPAEAIAQGIGFDDFAIGRDGKSVFVTTHAQNTVVRVDVGAAVNGAAQPVVVAGAPDKLDLPGSTACAFGRGEKDQSTLYVVTTGGLSVPVNGQVEPAKVAAVEIA